jgi:hypothetical protein
MLGLVIAVVAVLSSALQQIMCGMMQRRHLVSSHQLLSNTAHIQVQTRAQGCCVQQGQPAEHILQLAYCARHFEQKKCSPPDV